MLIYQVPEPGDMWLLFSFDVVNPTEENLAMDVFTPLTKFNEGVEKSLRMKGKLEAGKAIHIKVLMRWSWPGETEIRVERGLVVFLFGEGMQGEQARWRWEAPMDKPVREEMGKDRGFGGRIVPAEGLLDEEVIRVGY